MKTSDQTTETNNGPQRHWFARLKKGTLDIQQCDECHRHVFYPRTVCPHCGSCQLNWVPASGRGTVYSTTVIRNKPENGGDFNLALIDLEEGVRMMGRVIGIPPAAVCIGVQVAGRIVKENDQFLVVWELGKDVR